MISYASINLDSWFPFYGDDFNAATRMWSREQRMSYLDCLWYYWSHTKCHGLPNDDDMLRRLCGCDLKEWARTKGAIFDNRYFFVLRGGYWHQKRARMERAARLHNARRQMLRTMNATRIRNERRNEQRDVERESYVTNNVDSDTRSTLRRPNQNQNQNTTKKASSTKGASKLSGSVLSSAIAAEGVLGEQWVNDAGKWIERCKADPSKVMRVMAEVEQAKAERRIKTTPAQYAEQCWKEFQ